MLITLLLSTLGPRLRRLACQWREARRLRRDLAELTRMGAHELRDLGLSHAAVAAAARHDRPCA